MGASSVVRWFVIERSLDAECNAKMSLMHSGFLLF